MSHTITSAMMDSGLGGVEMVGEGSRGPLPFVRVVGFDTLPDGSTVLVVESAPSARRGMSERDVALRVMVFALGFAITMVAAALAVAVHDALDAHARAPIVARSL